jgi:hypothetical protein
MDFAPHGSRPDEDEAFLAVRAAGVIQELIDEHARVSGDIVPIDGHTWAIHGLIAVDGDVIMAEFGQLEQAREVLEQIRLGVEESPPAPGSSLDDTDSP